ncbi:MAG: SpoIIIAC/SpoIIIAD family protein [Clostridia bacterium]|nr:SpoIIIAC/SpoIIIAD family protein [Clostridia bacterium]
MEIFKVVGFCIIATVLIIIIKQQKPEMALMLTIVAAVGIMLFAISKMSDIFNLLDNLASKSGINKDFLIIIIKVTLIAYIVEFGKNICSDAGQTAIATKLEMAGKVIIVTLSLPIINSLVNILSGLV